MINTIIFDFDGVIADSVSSIFKWFQHAASVFNIKLPIQSINELKTSFFEPFPEFYKYLGFQWDKDVNKIYEEYISYHASHPVLLTDGIKPLIEELATIPGIKLGIVSSNVEELLFRNLYHQAEDMAIFIFFFMMNELRFVPKDLKTKEDFANYIERYFSLYCWGLEGQKQ